MATFEANSVNICAKRQIKKSNNKKGKSFIPAKYVPSIFDIPDAFPPIVFKIKQVNNNLNYKFLMNSPLANAKPPPRRKIKDHGTF